MIKITLLASLVTATLLTIPSAKADTLSLRVCEYVQANDKNRLRSYLKQKKLKVRSIYKGFLCNDSTLLVFAAKSKALEVGEFLIGKLPAKMVAAEIEDITKYSAHLGEEARDRVN